MNDDGLGLVISEDHEETINSFDAVPVSFKATDLSQVPEAWESPIRTWHQQQTSSCAGHAGAANFTHRQFVETGEATPYSPWFSYITSQRRGGFSGLDGGTSIKSVIIAATEDGCCLESLCPRPSHYSQTLGTDAVRDAASHKHIGGVVDLREWDTVMDWLTDMRSVVIGTKWMSEQRSVRDIETKAKGSSGGFLGYHARALIGFSTIGGVRSPRVLNSHGTGWGSNGRATIERDLWEWWRRDANFVALGFTDISERVPARRDWTGFNWSGSDTPDWVKGIA